MRFIIYFFLSLFWVPLVACNPDQRETYTVIPVDLDYTILASCTVREPAPYDIKAPSGGEIEKSFIREGDDVEKGQLLVQIDDFRERRDLIISENNLESVILQIKDAKDNVLPSLKEKLKQDAAGLSNAERFLNRLKQLDAAGGSTKVDIDQAVKNYEQALSQYNQTKIEIDSFSSSGTLAKLETQRRILEAQVALSEKSLSEKKIAAPYLGVITNVYVNEGEVIPDHFPVATIIAKEKWVFEANIDQRDLPFVSRAQPAVIVLDAYPSRKIEAEVVFVCIEVDIAKGSCQVKLTAKGDEDVIKFGMTGHVEITAKTYHNVLAVPSRFLERKDGDGYVHVVKADNVAKTRAEYQTVGEKWVILKNIAQGSILSLPGDR